MIFKQKPVFLKIINALIYMYPLKERTQFWRAAGTEGCQSLYVHYFVFVSYSSFKLGIITAYGFLFTIMNYRSSTDFLNRAVTRVLLLFGRPS